ncbi:MAG: hypothetical protein ACSHW1_15875 [Yoonia sp.]|uniref:hypothetical protein n=1 Tax=Yoonia sp. TaxID=2212373 RepID=UPI003EF70B1E
MHIDERKQVSRKAGNREDLPDGQAKPGTDHRESADGYRGVLIDWGDYRVATCRDDLQWLLQRRRPRFAGVGTAWDTVAFVTTRAALIRLHRSHRGCDALELLSFPEHFKSGGQ